MKTTKFIVIVLFFQFFISTSFTQYYDDWALVPDEKDGKFGYILSDNNNIIIEYQFEEADLFYSGLAKVCKNGKYGFIDKYGTIAIEFEYDDAGSFYGNFCNVKKNGLWGFIDQYNNLVIDFKYEMAFPFTDGFAAVMKNGKYGFIDEMDLPATDFIFDHVHYFMENECQVMENDTSYTLYSDGFYLSPIMYETNYFSLGQGIRGDYTDNKWSLYNQIKGESMTPFIFEDLHFFSEGLIAVRLNSKWGFVDKNGNNSIEYKYENAGNFSCGLANVKFNGKWGYIDRKNNIIIPNQYDYASLFQNDLAWVLQDGKVFLIDRSGAKLPADQLGKILHFSEGLAVINIDGRFGFINTKGEVVINPQFDFVTDFHSGRSRIKSGWEFGYIDRSGVIAIEPEYFNAQDFNKGGAFVRNLDRFGYDLIDTLGRIINDHPYLEVRIFHEGLAAVNNAISPELIESFRSFNNEQGWGYINSNGFPQTGFYFNLAGDFKNGYAPVQKESNWYFINAAGEQVSDSFYQLTFDRNYIIGTKYDENNDNFMSAFVSNDGTLLSDWFNQIIPFDNNISIVTTSGMDFNLKALMDTSFNIISEYYYDISKYNRNLFIVTKTDSLYNSMLAFINSNGKQTCEWFNQIQWETEKGYFVVSKINEDNEQVFTMADPLTGTLGEEWFQGIGGFENGTGTAENLTSATGDKIGSTCINLKGKRLCGFYDYVSHIGDGFCIVEDNEQLGLVTHSGLYPGWFSEYQDASEEIALVYGSKKYWYIDINGKLLTNNKTIREALPFHEGRAVVADKKGLYGYIDTEGKLIIPFIYTEAGSFSEGLAGVRNSKGKYGFLYKDGKTAIDFIFDSVQSFEDGKAMVSKDLQEYYIDKTGKKIE